MKKLVQVKLSERDVDKIDKLKIYLGFDSRSEAIRHFLKDRLNREYLKMIIEEQCE